MSRSKRPNVILIMTDNQPNDLLGCYGNTEIHTPHLDRMAREGIRFDNAYCPNSMCSPCRASVWTGRMPCQHGVHTWIDDRQRPNWPDNWNAVAEFETLPEILKKNGYATAIIGKYHLGVPTPGHNGIDHWVTMERGHTLDFHGNTMNVNGEIFNHEGHSVDFFTEKAVEYIEGRHDQPDDPFLLLLPYNGPYGHWPSIKGPAGNRFAHLYEDTPMNLVPREGLSREAIDCYELNKNYHPREKGGPDFSALLQIPNDLASLRNYYSQMTLIDDGVGKVLDTLAKNNLDEDTIVIFTADHGFSLGHHGFWGHAQATWPSNMFRIAYNIPLIVRAPGPIAGGLISARYVSSMDLYATIIDSVGLMQAVVAEDIPARSFAKLFDNPDSNWDDVVFFEQEETRAIRTPDWLYAKRFDQSEEYPLENELYDLSNDPDERINLAGNSKFNEIENELSTKIDTYFQTYASPQFDLWQGGTVKSNSSRPWLWENAWGDTWHPIA